MTILRAKTAGFCMGVSLALQKLNGVLQAQQAAGGHSRMVMLGPIIHNPQVLAEVAAQGVVCVQHVDDVRAGDTVVVRAHGIPRQDEARLAMLGATIIDATCPKVKNAQLAIDAATAQGQLLFLFGEEDHPEVRGLVSYANGECRVFSSPEGMGAIPQQALVLAAQTTQEQTIFKAIAAQLQHSNPATTVLSTICDATAKRQKETVDIARKVDMMLVIGGRDSGNTRRLADVARAEGVHTLHIECMEELTEAGLFKATSAQSNPARCQIIGLTAGASTPKALVDAVQNRLEELQSVKLVC